MQNISPFFNFYISDCINLHVQFHLVKPKWGSTPSIITSPALFVQFSFFFSLHFITNNYKTKMFFKWTRKWYEILHYIWDIQDVVHCHVEHIPIILRSSPYLSGSLRTYFVFLFKVNRPVEDWKFKETFPTFDVCCVHIASKIHFFPSLSSEQLLTIDDIANVAYYVLLHFLRRSIHP